MIATLERTLSIAYQKKIGSTQIPHKQGKQQVTMDQKLKPKAHGVAHDVI